MDSVHLVNDDTTLLDASRTVLTPLERAVKYATMIIHSKLYSVVYFIIAICCIITLLWSFIEPHPTTSWFIAIEVLITTVLSLEVGINMIAVGVQAYIKSWANLFDIVVLILCYISLILHEIGKSHRSSILDGEDSDDGMIYILLFRNVIIVLRVVNMLRKQRSKAQSKPVSLSSGGSVFMVRSEVVDVASDDGDEHPHQVLDNEFFI